MSDTKSNSDCLMHDNNSENNIAALKEKLTNINSNPKLNGTNGNGAHTSNKINSKDQALIRITNGVNSQVDNGIELKSSQKYTNTSINSKHINGTSKNSVQTTSESIENIRKANDNPGKMIENTGNC